MKFEFNGDIRKLTSDLKDNKRGKITIKVLANRNEELYSVTKTFGFTEMRKYLFKNIKINEQNVRRKISDLAQSVAVNKILDEEEKLKYHN